MFAQRLLVSTVQRFEDIFSKLSLTTILPDEIRENKQSIKRGKTLDEDEFVAEMLEVLN